MFIKMLKDTLTRVEGNAYKVPDSLGDKLTDGAFPKATRVTKKQAAEITAELDKIAAEKFEANKITSHVKIRYKKDTVDHLVGDVGLVNPSRAKQLVYRHEAEYIKENKKTGK